VTNLTNGNEEVERDKNKRGKQARHRSGDRDRGALPSVKKRRTYEKDLEHSPGREEIGA